MGTVHDLFEPATAEERSFANERTKQRVENLKVGESLLINIHAWSRVSKEDLTRIISELGGAEKYAVFARFGGLEIVRRK